MAANLLQAQAAALRLLLGHRTALLASSALCLHLISKSDSIGRRNRSATPSSTEALVAGPLPNVAHIGGAVCEGSFRFETKRPSIQKEGRVIFLNVLRALRNSGVASFH